MSDRFRPYLLSVAVVVGVVVSLVPPVAAAPDPAPSSVATSAGTPQPVVPVPPTVSRRSAKVITISPTQPMAGELVSVRGTSPRPMRRAVRVERKVGATWRKLVSGRTSRAGRYTLSFPMNWSAATVRVRMPAAKHKRKHKNKRVAAFKSPPRRLTTAVQAASLVVPQYAELGKTVQVAANLRPARAGRVVQLERLVGSAWRVVATTRQDTRGTVSWTPVLDAEGEHSIRATAPTYRGAPAVRSVVDVVEVRRRPAPGERRDLQRALVVTPGTVELIDVSGELDTVATVSSTGSLPSGVTVTRTAAGQLLVSATSGAVESQGSTVLRGTGCFDGACETPYTLTLDVVVAPLQSVSGGESFSAASGDRVRTSTDLAGDLRALDDELIVTLGTAKEPGSVYRAQSLAESVGAVVSGALESVGVYELRWTEPVDLDAVIEVLRGWPDVAQVSRSMFGADFSLATPPGDWSDDGPAATWPFSQIRAQQAWDTSTGGNTTVGVVDVGTAFVGHEDLDVQVLGGEKSDPHDHASHVAGLACGKSNGIGLVGAAWGCPVLSAGVGSGDNNTFAKNALKAATDVARSGAGVVNMSLGYNAQQTGQYCVMQSRSDEVNALAQSFAEPFRHLFNGSVGRDVVWTLAAGNNCGEGVHSSWGASWALPNVITVAATNSDKSLARFSNFGPGVEVAAPGGVGVGLAGGSEGVWSTITKRCGFFGWSTCSSYGPMPGTSMSAPLVAGVAALVRSANLGLTAADVGSCIVGTAGTSTGSVTKRGTQPAKLGDSVVTPFIPFTKPIPIVDAEAAVACAYDGSQRADVLITGAGDRTASGNGTDRGDLFAALSATGRTVASAEELPDDLSSFGQIWHLDTVAWTPSEQDQVADFVTGGGSLYLTGEWGCCTVDSSTIALLNRLVDGAEVSHGGATGDDWSIAADAPYGLGSTPNRVASVHAASPGSLSGVTPEHAVAGDGSRAVLAAWGPEAVRGHGRIAVMMDINWVAEQYRAPSWGDLVENLARFLD